MCGGFESSPKDLTGFCTFEDILTNARCSLVTFVPFLQADSLVGCGLIAIVYVLTSNKRNPANAVKTKIARESGLIPSLVIDAVKDVPLVQLTTTERVVYVGWIFIGPMISEQGEISDVAIFPLRSGYLDHETQEIRLQIDNRERFRDYILDQVTQGLLKMNEINARLQEMSVLLPIANVNSMTRYVEELDKSHSSK